MLPPASVIVLLASMCPFPLALCITYSPLGLVHGNLDACRQCHARWVCAMSALSCWPLGCLRCCYLFVRMNEWGN